MEKKFDLKNTMSENRLEMRKNLDNLMETIAEHIEFIQFQARIIRIEYDEYIKVGFTPEQALVLCKKTDRK